MEIPGWFGLNEFYAIILTVNIYIFSRIVITIIEVKKSFKLKGKFKSWWESRKQKKEDKIYGRV